MYNKDMNNPNEFIRERIFSNITTCSVLLQSVEDDIKKVRVNPYIGSSNGERVNAQKDLENILLEAKVVQELVGKMK